MGGGGFSVGGFIGRNTEEKFDFKFIKISFFWFLG
jgi:hypothetical protein